VTWHMIYGENSDVWQRLASYAIPNLQSQASRRDNDDGRTYDDNYKRKVIALGSILILSNGKSANIHQPETNAQPQRAHKTPVNVVVDGPSQPDCRLRFEIFPLRFPSKQMQRVIIPRVPFIGIRTT
jgi:hypothetical protein